MALLRIEYLINHIATKLILIVIGVFGLIKFIADFNFALIIVSLLLVLFLVFSLFFNYKNTKRIKIFENKISNLTKLLKEQSRELNDVNNEEIAVYISGKYILKILNTASSIFSNITGYDCTASVMMVFEVKDYVSLNTCLYDSGVNNKRALTEGSRVNIDSGVAGKIFGGEGVSVWSKLDKDFSATRKNYLNFYKSGISAGFVYDSKNVGILNIDSLAENIFSVEKHKNIMITLADFISLSIEILDKKLNHINMNLDLSLNIDEILIKIDKIKNKSRIQ